MKRTKSTVYCLSLFFGLFAACLLLAACSEPGDGGAETVTVTIGLGSAGSSRVFAEDAEDGLTLADISHKVTLTNIATNAIVNASVTRGPSSDSATATITEGNWRTDVEARLDDGSIYAYGTDTRLINASTGNINVTMSRAVIFDPDGGSGRVAPKQGGLNEIISLPYGTGLTRSGHVFVGWHGAPAAGLLQDYKATGTYQLTSSIELYAKWLQIPLVYPADINSYLVNADPEVVTLSSPLPLPVDMELTSGDWTAMFTAINNSGKYVNLDLSSSTSSAGGPLDGDAFDPRIGLPETSGSFAGRDKIVELTLPDAATSIAAIGATNPAFFGFDSLRSVSGSNVTDIGNSAFNGITALTSFYFPNVTDIGDSAFQNTGLTSVNIPLVTTIGLSAFRNCSIGGSLSLPEVTEISGFAFANDSSIGNNITSLYLPKVTDIGSDAFYNNNELDSIIINGGCTINTAGGTQTGRFYDFLVYYNDTAPGSNKAAGTYTWTAATGWTWEGP